MKFLVQSDDLLSASIDMIALPFFQDQVSACPQLPELDRRLDGLVSTLIDEENFRAKPDQRLMITIQGALPSRRLLLVGLGKREDFHTVDCRVFAAHAVREAQARGCQSLGLSLPVFDASAQDRAVQSTVEGVLLSRYRFDRYRSREDHDRDRLEKVVIVLQPERAAGDASKLHGLAVARAEVIAESVNFARDLTNEPPSVLTPARLSDLASELAAQNDFSCKVFGPRECSKQKMMLLLAVSRGSTEEPRFIHLTYHPKGKEKPRRRLVLLGKGVTFDAGGLSLKSTENMVDMKSDMAGAAVVLAAARALPALGIKSEVHILIPAAENMPSGNALKIGDIVTGHGGRSVEIVNTDAEGRLLLADALAYGSRLAPDEMLDFATLTGACVVALGPHHAGVMGNDRALVERFLASCRRAGEEAWPLPLPARLKEQLKSPVADLKNSGDRWGGALTAGLFLQEFVGKSLWLHVDIAGPSMADKEWAYLPKGGTGFGVMSLLDYLRSRDEA